MTPSTHLDLLPKKILIVDKPTYAKIKENGELLKWQTEMIMRNNTQVVEVDPTGRNPHEPGAKLDEGKPCLYRGLIDYFPRAITEVAKVSTFGASKYAWKGWETVPDGVARYSDAMVRHLAKEATGEDIDPDSGLYHAAHTAWGALARLELMLREKSGTKTD